ncbi:methyl-accepting chemotaxis protein [Methanoregula sp.]|uniref:methyl-accepting chemotaxis protein n=1 Tax=Methanoregula sp. TaxID=2052170 RepID=UPI003563C46A
MAENIGALCRSVLDAVPVAVLLIRDGVFVDCNRAAIKAFHARDANDLIGKAPSIISPERQPNGKLSDDVAGANIALALQGKPQVFEWQHKTLDGKLFYVEVALEKVEYEGKIYLQVNFRDTTLQKKMENFQLIFRESPIAQVIIDTQYNFLEVNEAFCRIIGYPMDRVRALKITEFRTQGLIKYLKDSGQSFTDAIRDKKITRGESTWQSPSGMHVVLRTNIPIYDEKGDVSGVYVSYTEITKIVKTQEFMAREVEALNKVYAQMAEGDLTVRYELSPPDDDTREVYDQLIKLRNSVRGIVVNLEKNIADVNERMLNLTSTAENATRSVEDGAKGVAQIAKNTSKVSENAEKASESVEQITKAMQDMSAAVEEITSSMESVSHQAKESGDLATKGADLAKNVEKGMGDIAQSAGKVYDIVMAIEKQMAEISKIVVLIRDLANQTNLLALNAAIEAARAGEHGRGFAVVASEVKSLAQDSRSSAEKIEDMIATLNAVTKNATIAMEDARAIVGTGTKMSSEALAVFLKINESVDRVAKSASEVAAATEEQAATTEEVTASVHEVSSIMVQTAREAGDAAAATEQSSAALDEISRMVSNVNKVAIEAMEANKKFRVE